LPAGDPAMAAKVSQMTEVEKEARRAELVMKITSGDLTDAETQELGLLTPAY